MINIRDELQVKAVNKYSNKGIFFLCPRIGKIRITFFEYL